jgi:hypothetical protein
MRQETRERQESLYIGGGFIDAQLLLIIPLAHGYCIEEGIRRLVFERRIPSEIWEQEPYGTILSSYEVSYSGLNQLGHLNTLFRKMQKALGFVVSAFRLADKSSARMLLSRSAWYEKQLRHAVWDEARRSAPDGKLLLSFLGKWISAIRVLLSADEARSLVKRYQVASAFLGHTVYTSRALLAEFGRSGIDVFAHANGVLYRTPREYDSSWSVMSRKGWEHLFGFVDQHSLEASRFSRMGPKGSLEETGLETLEGEDDLSRSGPNAIFLHVFRDSPFNHIDEDRIFVDYVDWVVQTLRIISNSKECWVIKKHPSAGKWGEDQDKWLDSITNEVFGPAGLPSHITIIGDESEYVSLIATAKRIVTFSGTVHLEAAALGTRPIVICDVTMTAVEPSALAKPRNLKDYESLLTDPLNPNLLELPEETMKIARTLLYCLDNALTLNNDIGVFHVYRGDSKSTFDELFGSTLMGIRPWLQNLVSQGRSLGKGSTRTFSPNLFQKMGRTFKY